MAPRRADPPTQPKQQTRGPSRLPREHPGPPPLSAALKRVMDLTGVSGMELTRRLAHLGRSQSSVARYYTDREPDYAMTLEIERALKLPRGTLFSMAGYAIDSNADSLAAILDDQTITNQQRFVLMFMALEAMTGRPTTEPHADALAALVNDRRLPEGRRRQMIELVQQFRAETHD